MDLAKKKYSAPLGQGIREGNISERLWAPAIASEHHPRLTSLSSSHKNIRDLQNGLRAETGIFKSSGWCSDIRYLSFKETGIP